MSNIIRYKFVHVQEARLAQELEDTERRLKELEAMQIPGFEEAVAVGVRDYHQRRAAGAGRRLLANATLSSSSSSASTRASANVSLPLPGQWTAAQRAAYAVVDGDLDYMIYWMDLTDAMKTRWGTEQDSMGNNFTRLFSNPCDASEKQCGILEYIPRYFFRLLDRDGNGLLSLAEYQSYFPDGTPADQNGFISGYTFARAAINGTGGSLTMTAWVLYFGMASSMMQASIKDPTLRSFWTPCGVQTWGTPLGPSGNASKDPRLATWLPTTSFEQLADGRLTRRIVGLNDSDNNVYLLNIVVRNRVTGESAAYKVHTVQRRTPVYRPPEMGPTQVGLMVGVAVSIAAAAAILVVAVLLARRRKTRPRLRIRKQ
mmetsp:Transcript_11418/g.31848  ORF Transcript_11418/g.31848 Transcript_11418/m.31848 type:complete len:372 (+) Transcript_11418:36-1151(+)